MHYVGVIGFLIFGIAAIALGIAHEIIWWKRRGWRRGRGVVVGFREKRNDGVSYFPEIQFDGPNGLTTFVSDYGSDEKPELGCDVYLAIDPSNETGEQVSVSNRTVFTIVPIAFGVLFIVVGLNIQPLDSDEPNSNHPGESESAVKPHLDARN